MTHVTLFSPEDHHWMFTGGQWFLCFLFGYFIAAGLDAVRRSQARKSEWVDRRRRQ